MNSNYFEIETLNISQIQSGTVLIGKLTFAQILTIHRLTERKESLTDPFGDSRKILASEEDEEFQRQLSPNKLSKISDYLSQELTAYKQGKATGLFPTSLIIALNHDFEYDQDNVNLNLLESFYSTSLNSCFVNNSGTKLYIPKNNRIALIVDGQHRFYGLKKLYATLKDEKDKDILENFEFLVTFLIGFDIYEVGKVFAVVNFTQKPVNRSLYYDIFGSVPDVEKNDIKLAHDLALHLNNNVKSPVKDMIKMLGKGYGLFSQAFFVEKMLIHFKSGGVWEDIYLDYLNHGTAYKILPVFMKAYLGCIEECYKTAWPEKVERNSKLVYSPYNYNYVLCKTTGIGAFFRLIKDIFPKVELIPEQDMKKEISRILKRISDSEAERVFSKFGEYGGAGSEGIQLKLYRFLKSKLSL